MAQAPATTPDVDECSQSLVYPCDAVNGDCTNMPGSYICICNPGFLIDPSDPSACSNVDECDDGSDTCDSTTSGCVDTAGSFNCICDPGYEHPTGSTTICNGRTIETVEGFGHIGSDILFVFGVHKKQL
eukprot:XP_003730378.1 PREDICTED: EGF-like module-containing mucin-like hormone receptor-like 2 [Strongylocentrotus purpuratus]